jgi:hypothetical protein
MTGEVMRNRKKKGSRRHEVRVHQSRFFARANDSFALLLQPDRSPAIVHDARIVDSRAQCVTARPRPLSARVSLARARGIVFLIVKPVRV